MNWSNIKNNKGLTLVEVLVATALTVLVIAVIFSLYLFGNRSFAKSRNQYDIQSDVRLAMDAIVKELRFATSMEILNADKACDISEQEEGFNYIYIDDGKLLHSIYDEVSGERKIVSYGSHFKAHPDMFVKIDSSTLGIDLISEYNGQSYSAKTEISLLNFESGEGNSIMDETDSLELKGLKYKGNPSL